MTKTGILKPKTVEETSQLIKVALGKENADLAVINAKVVNVYTGELLEDQAITVKDKWIAYVGQDVKDAIGPVMNYLSAIGSQKEFGNLSHRFEVAHDFRGNRGQAGHFFFKGG